MRVITLLAAKGGVGRTVATLALAAAYLARGRRVRVVDAGDGARGLPKDDAGDLEGWWGRVAQGTKLAGLLRVSTARDASGLLAALDCAAGAPEDDGAEVVLVDTAGRTDDRARLALRASDLVIAPFRNAADATWVIEGLGRDLARTGLTALALPCGVEGDAEEAGHRFRESERASSGGKGGSARLRLARAALPDALPLVRQLWHGPLPTLDPVTVAPEGADAQATVEARAAWAAALMLAEEAWDAATGPDPAVFDARPPVLRLARMRGGEGGAEVRSDAGPGTGPEAGRAAGPTDGPALAAGAAPA